MADGINMRSIPFKLPEKLREDFKKITHNQGTSMQAVLSAFSQFYVDNPDKFKIKMEIVDGE